MGVIMRQSIKGTIVNYIGVGVGFITTFFILTKYLTTEEIGLTRTLVDAAVLFSGLAQLGTNSSMMRFYPYFKDPDDKDNDHGIFFWSILIPFIGFLLFLACFFIFKGTIIDTFSEKSPLFTDYIYFVIPLSFFMLYQAVFEVNSNLLMRIAIPKLIREVVIRVLLLCTYLLYAFDFLTLNQFVIVFCGCYGIATLLNIIYLFSIKRVSFKPDFKFLTKPLLRNIAFYTLFLITAALAGNITPTLNTFFISAKMGVAFTGIYAIANYIAAVIEIPYRSLGAITQPELSLAIKTNDIAHTNKLCQSTSLVQLIASSFIFFLIWINIDFIFEILPNGDSYKMGKWVVFILGLSRLFNSTLSIGISVLGYSKYYYFSLIFTVLLTATAIYCNTIFIPKWGMTGAALASAVSYCIYYFFLLGLIQWKIKTTPFSFGQLKTVGLFVILFILNGLFTHYISPLFTHIPLKPIYCLSIEAAVKTITLFAIGLTATYYFKLSKDINSLITRIIKRIKN